MKRHAARVEIGRYSEGELESRAYEKLRILGIENEAVKSQINCPAAKNNR